PPPSQVDNTLTKDQVLRDEGVPRHCPDQDLQGFLGQVAPLSAVGSAAVVEAGEAPSRARPLLQGGDPALHEISEHVPRGEAALRQRPDLVQHGVELWLQGRLGPPGCAVGGGPLSRQGEALVGFGGGDHPIPAPLLSLSASKAGNVRSRQVTPYLEVVPPPLRPCSFRTSPE